MPTMRVWTVFGVTPPSAPMPVWVEPERPCNFDRQCQASEAARRQAYEDAYAAYKARHMELDARIREFNSDYGSRLERHVHLLPGQRNRYRNAHAVD